MQESLVDEMNIRRRHDEKNMKTASTQSLNNLNLQLKEFKITEQTNSNSPDNDKHKFVHDVVWCDLAEQFRLNLITQLDEHLKVSLNDLVSTAISRDSYLQNTQALNDWMTDKNYSTFDNYKLRSTSA
ncbi:Sterol O-acyltransferase 1 [Schistosoma haematobium]|uniref:Sterol O-acyltransferase 1 n=1 Tax=Schistosoma haematobium TaxID=6185 RepID=A0A922S1U9_SCHHA|nr:Sterol O-acyltransferase 1 [Schistosoma haematobium]KAH9590194.1 Sterol O-acyltransferase 1 [Schistosoma haematobium]